ncbi:hypothetical protein [Lentzea cavernae]|uniref:Uncharacterized protein n=1 Tax=Lentzea cavernae TaxID=2020703 RepID=A0ABQ3MT12_9PSEU|nr:hypothetical protein [Lentzea cavernae]GHH57512.1 hypothetical protein GCM10017774_77130 [Lentzea cavernae]
MSELPNLDLLGQKGPNDLTAEELQLVLIRQEAGTPVPTEIEWEMRLSRLGRDVPALLAFIDKLLGDNKDLREYSETTKYHQDKHAAAVRELEMVRAELTHLAGPLATEDRPNASIEDLLIAVGGDLKYHRSELEKARAEVVQIAIDTSPAYAELRDERDSARRERDEAMTKLADLRGTTETDTADDGVHCECDGCRDGGTCHNCEQYPCTCGGAR